MLRFIEKALVSTGIVGTIALLVAWCTRILIRRPGPTNATSVRALLDATPPLWILIPVGVSMAIVIAALLRKSLLSSRTLAIAVSVTLPVIGASIALHHGHHAAIVALALGLAIFLGAQLAKHDPAAPDFRLRDRGWALGAFAVVLGINALFSLHRYYWMGAGSWDLGCMIHNLYRASHLLDSTSTVLGDVDYLGDHFMIGIYLYSPLAWINSSGYMMLLIQSASLAATTPVVFLLARDRGAPLVPALVLALCAGLAFGMQSGAYFDAHEITIGFGFLALGVLFLERKQLGRATAAFVIFSLFKESLGAYVVGLGLLALWRGVRDKDRRHLIFGAGWVVYGTVWFVLVNRFFMPALIARGHAPEPHETFADFGPTVFQAAWGVLPHPLDAVGALFTPQEKVSSLLVTFGGLGFLGLASPELMFAAAPLFAERFLSSKSSMWEMGYHYAAPLSFYSAWAAAVAWPKVQAAAEKILRAISDELAPRAPGSLAIYVLASTILINGAAYRHPSNFHHWTEDYFSSPERRPQNARAIALIKEQGSEAKVAVQNRMLPHLADRPFVWRLGEWAKADYVLLNVSEDAWPYDGGHPRRIAHELAKNPAWKLVYSEGDTAVFARKETPLAAVPPDPTLLRP